MSYKEELVRINSICRAHKIMFYAGDVMGFYGFSFMDLLEHEYVEETTTHNKPAGLYIKKFQGSNLFVFYQT